MDWFIADNHFYHNRLIEIGFRKFASMEEMNEIMIENWNKVVKKNDIVYHEGDFCLYRNTEQKRELLNRLNGFKYIVLGNHDNRSAGHWQKLGVMAQRHLIIYGNLILTHRPVICSNYINIHGHTHGNLHRGDVSTSSPHICVSVEAINYTPISYDEILERIKK